MKTLLIILIMCSLYSCGGGYKVSGNVKVTVGIDIDWIKDFCETTYETDKEIKECKIHWMEILNKLMKESKNGNT